MRIIDQVFKFGGAKKSDGDSILIEGQRKVMEGQMPPSYAPDNYTVMYLHVHAYHLQLMST